MPLFDFPERKHGLSLRGGTGAVGLLSSWPWLPSAPPVSCGLWEKENIWRAQESLWWLKGLPRNLPVAFSLKHHGVSILKHHPHPFFVSIVELAWFNMALVLKLRISTFFLTMHNFFEIKQFCANGSGICLFCKQWTCGLWCCHCKDFNSNKTRVWTFKDWTMWVSFPSHSWVTRS